MEWPAGRGAARGTGSSRRRRRKPPAALRLPLLDEADELRHDLSRRAQLGDGGPGPQEILPDRVTLRFSGPLETCPQVRAPRVNQDLLAVLGILEGDDPDVRNLPLSRVSDPDGDDFVAERQRAHRLLPAIRGHEITEDDEERRAA